MFAARFRVLIRLRGVGDHELSIPSVPAVGATFFYGEVEAFARTVTWNVKVGEGTAPDDVLVVVDLERFPQFPKIPE